MADWMARFREWLGVNNDHTAEHVAVRRDLTAQRLRLDALDAYVEARSPRRDRRKVMTASHPDRRVGDA